MDFLDPAMRKVTRAGFGLAGALIGAAQRRGRVGPRRTPDRLLLEDASGIPGPALVGPVADYDRVLLPEEIDPTQARELAAAAGKIVLRGVGLRLLDVGKSLVAWDERTERDPAEDGADEQPSTEAPAQRAAWERFVTALERVTELQASCAIDPDELAAEDLRWAEVELEDAVAVAGEFGVKKIRWLLA